MITRAHIRRQLRASGGITNVTPREGYFLGKLVRGAKKAVGKVANVAKQVVKSPIGKAAILGLGASYLGPKIMSGGLGGLKSSLFGSIIPGVRAASMPGNLGLTGFTSTKGLLGKLGLTKGGGSMGITGLGKILGAGGLIGYFTSKGSSEEEAKELARDVYRGEGIGFDQIRADLSKYKSGDLSQSQMFDKNYRFLTPRNFVGAAGGRVGLKSGGDPLPEDPTKPINPFGPKPTGPVLPNKMAEIPKGLSMQDAVKIFKLSNDRDPKNMQELIKFFKNRKLSAEGGRIGFKEGTDKDKYGIIDALMAKPESDNQEYSLPYKAIELLMKPFNMYAEGITGVIEQSANPKKYYNMEEKPQEKAMGGIMDMPTGNMRRNTAGVMERDYRDEGGFVPVGVKEKADDVPAMLSKNEFVMTADAVRGAGDGNIKKGAQRMYDLMKRNEGKVA